VRAILCLWLFCLTAPIALDLASCSQPAAVTGVQAADVAAYGAEQESCVTGSATLAAANACIVSVKARWCGFGGQLQQLGACGQDAGPESGMPLPASAVKALGLSDGGAG
jgi:hypothetical protein